VPSIPTRWTCLTHAQETEIHEVVKMKEERPSQNKLIQVMQEMIDTGELTFTPEGSAILRYPQSAKTKTLFFSFFPNSNTVSVDRKEISSIGRDVGVLPQIYGTLYNKDFLTENSTGKISNFYGHILN
jgi:hypothetical protein